MSDVVKVSPDVSYGQVSLSIWLKDILTRTPGLVRKVAKRELQLAIREFYEQSCSWRVLIGPVDLLADKEMYWLSPYDQETDVVRILSIEVGTTGLRPIMRRPPEVAAQGGPEQFWVDPPDVFHVWPVPTADSPDNMTIYVALTPRVGGTKLPAIAQTLHYDAILDGVLGRLLSHPSKPYSNAVMAQYHLKRFRAAIGKYKAQGNKNYSDAGSWSFPRFGV